MDCKTGEKAGKLLEAIGEPASLELLAEECAELAHAALKLARAERGENPTPKTEGECMEEIYEEVADVLISIELLEKCPWWDKSRMVTYYRNHMRRFMGRVKMKEEADAKEV